MAALPTSFAASAPIASTSKGVPTRTVTASNPLAGPDTPHQRLMDQRELLDQLSEGEGIPINEWDGLFEKCYICKKFMLEAVFKAHSRDCWHMSDEESEVDADKWGEQ